MISLFFDHLNEKVLIMINGNDIKFGNTAFGAVLADISGLKLSYEGVIREFPDLKESENWKEEAINRFTEKIKSFKTEDEKAEYIIEDLRKFGYIPRLKERKGFRPEVIR